MRQFISNKEDLKKRLQLILVEGINTIDYQNIDKYIEKAIDRILEVLLDEITYNKGR